MKESPCWEPLGILHAHVQARVGGWMTCEGNGDLVGLPLLDITHKPIGLAWDPSLIVALG